MAFVRVEPVSVQVRTDWFDGRPREVTWGDQRMTVTRLVAVREEAAAYPVITGPRTLAALDGDRSRRTGAARRLIPHPPPATGPPSRRVGTDVGRRNGCAGTVPVPFRRPNFRVAHRSRNLQSRV